jgi:hypothetical protein
MTRAELDRLLATEADFEDELFSLEDQQRDEKTGSAVVDAVLAGETADDGMRATVDAATRIRALRAAVDEVRYRRLAALAQKRQAAASKLRAEAKAKRDEHAARKAKQAELLKPLEEFEGVRFEPEIDKANFRQHLPVKITKTDALVNESEALERRAQGVESEEPASTIRIRAQLSGFSADPREAWPEIGEALFARADTNFPKGYEVRQLLTRRLQEEAIRAGNVGSRNQPWDVVLNIANGEVQGVGLAPSKQAYAPPPLTQDPLAGAPVRVRRMMAANDGVTVRV